MKKKEIDKASLNELIHLSKNLIKIFYVIVVVGIILGVVLALKQLGLFTVIKGALKVISPLFIGFTIAWLFYPLHKKMLDKGFNKIVSAVLIFFTIVGIAILFIYIFIPVLYNQVNDLIKAVPSIFNSITDFIVKSLEKFDVYGLDIASVKANLARAGQNYIVNFTTSLPNNILSIVKTFFSALGIIIISLVIGIYMLIDFDDLTVRFYKLFPKKERKDYIRLFENMSENAHRVVNGTLLVALLVFICDTIGFSLIGLNAAAFFGLFCGITDLIPYIGPYIGGGAAVVVGFTQGPIIGIGVLIIAVVVQLLESYILQPVVMSKAMQLHPVVIIVGLLLFGYLFGIIGMIVATPCMAIMKEILLFVKSKKKGSKK